MVDFKKRAGKKAESAVINPVEIYDSLDRKSDKGPLRPAQLSVLSEWHQKKRANRDVILKLHTGQGKTLAGLLMLQSKLNETGKPVLYVCPNKFLAQQTLRQAEEFGVKCVTAESELPTEFTDGRAILVTHVQKLFNGKTKFGLEGNSHECECIVIDDAHACISAVLHACQISVGREHPCYTALLALFDQDLRSQGAGTHADIKAGQYDSLLPVPYWAWYDKADDTTNILAKERDSIELRFAWPLIRDLISACQCFISGNSLQITPYRLPIDRFGTFHNAKQRIFMSATMNDDSILTSGLGVNKEASLSPLIDSREKWSGEKMVIIPSIIAPDLDQSKIAGLLGRPNKKRAYGVVALVPSNAATAMWEKYGSHPVKSDDIDSEIEELRSGSYETTRVFANRYDGIDLPDASCRILVIDGKPYAQDLASRYEQSVRTGSDILGKRIATSIEQGMGRAVRGEKDYCAIVMTGPELVNFIRSSKSQIYFSPQTRKQIEIGIEIANMAQEEISEGEAPEKAFTNLIKQSLQRDQDWKEFYTKEMDSIDIDETELRDKLLEIYSTHRSALNDYDKGNFLKAANTIQKLIDKTVLSDSERGWYLQEMARLIYAEDKQKSMAIQKAAYGKNRYLLKPNENIPYKKIKTAKDGRINNIRKWLKEHGSAEEILLHSNEILTCLSFGVESDKFEESISNLGRALGFEAERPDKELKEGPDVLWAIEDNRYILFEAKNEVLTTRAAINKHEVGQMNTSNAWFKREYKGCSVTSIMIIPTHTTEKAAVFANKVLIMRERELGHLVRRASRFFKELSEIDTQNISEDKIREVIARNHLDAESLETEYAVSYKSKA